MPDRGPRRARAGVLRPAEAAGRIDIGRAAPPPSVAAYVDYLWWVTWDCPAPYRQDVIPRPVVHVYAEQRGGSPRLVVAGAMTRRFERRLEGTGRTVAAAFRPGGFRPFLGSAVGALRDRDDTVEGLLGIDDRELAATLLAPGTSPEDAAGELGAWLSWLEPPEDPRVADVAALVERAESDPSITRAEQLADLAGCRLRTLQRRFEEYVGTAPKGVVQRFRLLDVAEAAHGEQPVDWARLAVRLGYADQSHLVRAFTALVGSPPASYAAEQG